MDVLREWWQNYLLYLSFIRKANLLFMGMELHEPQTEGDKAPVASTEIAAFLQSQIVSELFGENRLDPTKEDLELLNFILEHREELRHSVLEDPRLVAEITEDLPIGHLSLKTKEDIEKKIHYHNWVSEKTQEDTAH